MCDEAEFDSLLAEAAASLTRSTGQALDVEAMLAEVKRSGARHPATVLRFPGGGVITTGTARAAARPAGGRRT